MTTAFDFLGNLAFLPLEKRSLNDVSYAIMKQLVVT